MEIPMSQTNAAGLLPGNETSTDKSSLAESLYQSARNLVPVLRERSAECAALGRLPNATLEAMHEAGFFRIMQPARYGGFELDPEVFFRCQMILAEGCMSTAWVLGVVAIHNWQLALFDDRAQQDVWGEDDSTLISSSYMPVGKVTRVDGGYRLSGDIVGGQPGGFEYQPRAQVGVMGDDRSVAARPPLDALPVQVVPQVHL